MFEIANKKYLNPRLVNLLRPNSIDAQRYHRLRLAVESSPRETSSVVVAITSPCAGEGKTLTAMNLAGALAQNPDCRVALIELDLRSAQGTMKDYIGNKKWSSPGMVDSVAASVEGRKLDWDLMAHYVPEFNLTLIPSGKNTESPYEVLNSPHLETIFRQARLRYDYIIVDTASVTSCPDTQLIAKWVDQFIVLVSAGVTSQRQLGDCLDLLPPEKVLGLVFNGCQKPGGERDGY
jgi:Mrp family chromosome partitioning ATPase